MNRACLHFNRSAQSTRCFLWGIKAFWVGDFFLFLAAVPRPTHTAMLALNKTVNWMVNNDDFFGLWFTRVNDQKNICKMGVSNYVLQGGFNKKTKGREISTILRYRWTGLGENIKHKKNWFVHMLCRQSTKALLANPLMLCSAWPVSPRLSHHNCTKALWPRAAGPDQLCAGQSQAGFSLPLPALQSQLGCDTHPWAHTWELPASPPGAAWGIGPTELSLQELENWQHFCCWGSALPLPARAESSNILTQQEGLYKSAWQGTPCSLCHSVVTQQSGVRGQRGYSSEPLACSLYPELFSDWNLSPTTVSLVPSWTLHHKANTCAAHADTLGSQGSTVHLKIGKLSFAKNLDHLHKQTYWQEFSPTFFLSCLLKKLSY